MDFRQFWQSYEDIVRRARRNELTMDDYAGTTISLTNPGGIGTVHSMPRLMQGQGTILGVGAMEYPAPFAGMSDEQLAELAISKIITLTSTYDHRIIQGAQSGEFLKVMHELLLGEHGFYDEIFTSLRIPYEPIRWTRDVAHTSEGQIDKAARVIELIHAYRVRGHLMADTDPLEYKIRRHPDLDVREHDLTLWDLDRTFPVGGFAGKQRMKLRDILGVLRDSYCRRVGVEYMHIQDPEERRWIQRAGGAALHQAVAGGAAPHPDPAQRRRGVRDVPADQVRGPEALLARGQPRASSRCSTRSCSASAEGGLDEVVIGMAHRGRLNVLANIVGKPYEKIFSEFEGHLDPRSTQGSGDVKYHLGMTGKYTTPDGEHAIDGQRRREPVPPRGRRPGAGGHRTGQAGPHRPQARGLHGAAAARARRRRVRRPGRRRRDAEPVAAARLPHRRHASTSSSTTRSASPRRRSTRGRRCTPPTSPA